jgi:hypothetical protein
VIPFAQLVSFTGAIGWPGVYFQRRWSVLRNNR